MYIQLWFPEQVVDFFGWKTRENVVLLDFLAVDNFDFTIKVVKKFGWKTRENSVIIWILGKNYFFLSVVDFIGVQPHKLRQHISEAHPDGMEAS